MKGTSSLQHYSADNLNKKKVLRLLHDRGPLSRKDLSEQLHISFGAVAHIVKMLTRMGLCSLEAESDTGQRGRPSQLVTLSDDYLLGVVLNFDPPHILISPCYMHSQNREYQSVDITPVLSLQSVLDTLDQELPRLWRRHQVNSRQTAGVLAVVPAIANKRDGMTMSAHHAWLDGAPLSRVLGEQLDLPVWVENDANMAALALARRYQGDNLCFLYLGTGLGVAVLNEGKLLTGTHGFAGEIGHVTAETAGRPCHCGRRGCVDAYLNEESLRSSRDDAREMARNAHILATVISNLIGLLDPAAIYLSCKSPDVQDILFRLLPQVKQQINTETPFSELRFPTIAVCEDPQILSSEGAQQQFFRYWLDGQAFSPASCTEGAQADRPLGT